MRKYGFLGILFLLWIVSTIAFGQTAKPDEFWPGIWENLQSEWAQLLLQGLLLVVWQSHVAAKASENTIQDVLQALKIAAQQTEVPESWQDINPKENPNVDT